MRRRSGPGLSVARCSESWSVLSRVRSSHARSSALGDNGAATRPLALVLKRASAHPGRFRASDAGQSVDLVAFATLSEGYGAVKAAYPFRPRQVGLPPCAST